MSTSSALAVASEYIRLNISPVPIPYRSKSPGKKDWQRLRIDLHNADQHFNGARQNIGAILGLNGLTDIDLDCSEARLAAEILLPETGCIYGRKSAPHSHRLYFVDGELCSKKFKDPILDQSQESNEEIEDQNPTDDRATLLEIRALKKDGTVGFQSLMPPSVHDRTGEEYTWSPGATKRPQNVDQSDLVLAAKKLAAVALLARYFAKDGSRHEAFLALAGVLARAGWPEKDAYQLLRAIYKALWPNEPEHANCKSEVSTTFEKYARGEATSGIPRLKELLNLKAVDQALEWLGISTTYQVENTEANVPEVGVPYPAPMEKEAFYGPVGAFTRIVDPETEADPQLVLVTALVAIGAYLGRTAYVSAGGVRHYGNLFAIGVGPSGSGRKGTAWPPAEHLFRFVDPGWKQNNVEDGTMSTGEGMIDRVHDELTKPDPKHPDKEILVSRGVEDKRVLWLQTEFSGCLANMARSGNNLSAIVRQAWETGDLSTRTKGSPSKATGAHTSIVANITRDSLLKGIAQEGAENGFINRFLFVCSRRSKKLPEGGNLELVHSQLELLAEKIKSARAWAAQQGSVERDADAGDLWGRNSRPEIGMYNDLTPEYRSGTFGEATKRAAPIVLRLALIYAMLDCSDEIKKEHLLAAHAVWKYCEASARYIFGDATGDVVADDILAKLRKAQAEGLTKTQISEALGRNQKQDVIDAALQLLKREGLAREEKPKQQGRGRPSTSWFAVT